MEWLIALVVLAAIAYVVLKRRRGPASTASAAPDTHHPCPSCATPVVRSATQCPNCKRDLPEGWAPAAGIAIPP